MVALSPPITVQASWSLPCLCLYERIFYYLHYYLNRLSTNNCPPPRTSNLDTKSSCHFPETSWWNGRVAAGRGQQGDALASREFRTRTKAFYVGSIPQFAISFAGSAQLELCFWRTLDRGWGKKKCQLPPPPDPHSLPHQRQILDLGSLARHPPPEAASGPRAGSRTVE